MVKFVHYQNLDGTAKASAETVLAVAVKRLLVAMLLSIVYLSGLTLADLKTN